MDQREGGKGVTLAWRVLCLVSRRSVLSPDSQKQEKLPHEGGFRNAPTEVTRLGKEGEALVQAALGD